MLQFKTWNPSSQVHKSPTEKAQKGFSPGKKAHNALQKTSKGKKYIPKETNSPVVEMESFMTSPESLSKILLNVYGPPKHRSLLSLVEGEKP